MTTSEVSNTVMSKPKKDSKVPVFGEDDIFDEIEAELPEDFGVLMYEGRAIQPHSMQYDDGR
jgi:hypothetical protein